MDNEVSKPSNRRGEVGVVVQIEAVVALVGVQVSGVDSELLNLHGLVQQQLLQLVLHLFLLKKFLDLFLQKHETIQLKIDSQTRSIIIQILNIIVSRLGMIDDQTMKTKILYKLFSYFIICHYHELLNQLLAVYSLFKADVDGEIGVV